MDKLKKVIKLISGLCIAAISGALVLTPPLTVIGVPALIISLGMTYDGLMKKDLKHNIFKVSRKNNELIENPFRIDRFLKCLFGRNKFKNFLNESMDCFKQLDVYENEQKVKYTMKSHGFTKKRLEELEKMGYIENLESKIMYNGKKKSFFLENLAMGNFKKLFKKKEKFEMSFNLTGKSFYNEEINNYVDYVINKHSAKPLENMNNNSSNNISINREKNEINKIDNKETTKLNDIRDTIVDLQKRREELLNSKYIDQEQSYRANVR